MDDDEREALQASRLEARDDFDTFGAAAASRAQRQHARAAGPDRASGGGGIIPGPVPLDLVVPVAIPAAQRLLRKMGWRSGGASGSTSRAARSARPSAPNARGSDSEGGSEGSEDFEETRWHAPSFASKLDRRGVGYDPFEGAEESRAARRLALSDAPRTREGWAPGWALGRRAAKRSAWACSRARTRTRTCTGGRTRAGTRSGTRSRSPSSTRTTTPTETRRLVGNHPSAAGERKNPDPPPPRAIRARDPTRPTRYSSSPGSSRRGTRSRRRGGTLPRRSPRVRRRAGARRGRVGGGRRAPPREPVRRVASARGGAAERRPARSAAAAALRPRDPKVHRRHRALRRQKRPRVRDVGAGRPGTLEGPEVCVSARRRGCGFGIDLRRRKRKSRRRRKR